MADETSELTPAAAADAADELWARIQAPLPDLDEAAWRTPVAGCPGWDVHDLVGHMSGLTTMFAGLPQPEPPVGWVASPDLNPVDAITERQAAARRGWSTAQLLEEVAAARQAHVAGLRALPDLSGRTQGPTGATTHRGLFAVRMFDLWHHLWDLHASTGSPLDAAADGSVAAREARAYVVDLAPWLYGRRGRAPEGAAVRLSLAGPGGVDRVIAVSDGRARWAEGGAAASDALTGRAADFALVMTGRADPGALQAEGPEAERLLRTRVFA